MSTYFQRKLNILISRNRYVFYVILIKYLRPTAEGPGALQKTTIKTIRIAPNGRVYTKLCRASARQSLVVAERKKRVVRPERVQDYARAIYTLLAAVQIVNFVTVAPTTGGPARIWNYAIPK
jgi:hypothetical protein